MMRATLLSDCDEAFNLYRSQRAKRYVRQAEIEPAKVVDLTAHAVIAGDKFLAAEIMSRLSTSLKSNRTLAFALRRELEDVIYGANKAQEAITIARNRARCSHEP